MNAFRSSGSNGYRKIKGTLHKKILEEIDLESLHRIDEAIAPYTRFIRAERDRLTETHDELTRIQGGLARLKAQIEDL